MEELITNKYLSITEREIKDLKPYINNPRKNDDAVATVEKSIKEFGFINPIVLDKDDSIIVGHTRLKAAIKLGYTKVPTITATDLSPAQVKAFRIMDNKSGEKAEWDWSLLKEELYSLEGTDSFDATGLEPEEITDVWEMEEDNKEVEEDNFVEPKKAKYKIALGDIFTLGAHRLMCGDATDFAMVKTLIDDEKIEMVYTDPPYGINEKGDRSERGGLTQGNNLKDFKDDSTEYAVKAFIICDELKIPKQVWWGANYYCHSLTQTNNWLVWDKRVEEKQRDTQSDCELAWVLDGHQSVRIFRHLWKGMIKGSEHGQKRVHPTQKPMELANYCFKSYGNPQTVLDLFGGSGSTLIACEQTNRKCRMMELDEHYVSVIIERWEKVTGQKAKKLSGGFPELK